MCSREPCEGSRESKSTFESLKAEIEFGYNGVSGNRKVSKRYGKENGNPKAKTKRKAFGYASRLWRMRRGNRISTLRSKENMDTGNPMLDGKAERRMLKDGRGIRRHFHPTTCRRKNKNLRRMMFDQERERAESKVLGNCPIEFFERIGIRNETDSVQLFHVIWNW